MTSPTGVKTYWKIDKAPRGRQGNAKHIVRNKVFECLALFKIEVIEYGKMGFKMA